MRGLSTVPTGQILRFCHHCGDTLMIRFAFVAAILMVVAPCFGQQNFNLDLQIRGQVPQTAVAPAATPAPIYQAPIYQAPQPAQQQIQAPILIQPAVLFRPYTYTGSLMTRHQYGTPLRDALFGRYRFTPIYMPLR